LAIFITTNIFRGGYKWGMARNSSHVFASSPKFLILVMIRGFEILDEKFDVRRTKNIYLSGPYELYKDVVVAVNRISIGAIFVP